MSYRKTTSALLHSQYNLDQPISDLKHTLYMWFGLGSKCLTDLNGLEGKIKIPVMINTCANVTLFNIAQQLLIFKEVYFRNKSQLTLRWHRERCLVRETARI